MHTTRLFAAFVLAAALSLTGSQAQAFDAAKYPDFGGVWQRATPGEARFDPSKPPGRGQDAPLTAEYRAVFEATLKDVAEGGKGDLPAYTCLAPGMPMIMNAHVPMEILVFPDVTYILIDHIYESVRRIFTDERTIPDDFEPTFTGYSIGKWIDTDGDGKYDLLEVETRSLKGPRVFDESGLTLHSDNMSIIRNASTSTRPTATSCTTSLLSSTTASRPWTVMKSYKREMTSRLAWRGGARRSTPRQIGTEFYKLDPNGFLMPTKRNQAPPDPGISRTSGYRTPWSSDGFREDSEA
jgi:hypothetical protein